MDKQQVVSSLEAFVKDDLLHGEAEDLDATTPLLELRILDSFSILKLLTYVESNFGASIPIEQLEIDRLKDIDTIADLVIEASGEKRSA